MQQVGQQGGMGQAAQGFQGGPPQGRLRRSGPNQEAINCVGVVNLPDRLDHQGPPIWIREVRVQTIQRHRSQLGRSLCQFAQGLDRRCLHGGIRRDRQQIHQRLHRRRVVKLSQGPGHKPALL